MYSVEAEHHDADGEIDDSANCHNENAPTATTKSGQLPQRNRVNCHNENAPTVTIE
nr:hypothetical protein [Prevotella sp.]